MNVRQSIKAAAVAIPMMFSAGKVAAQSQTIVKEAEKIVATDTLKALDAKATDARTLVLKQYHGRVNGNIKGGKFDNGTLKYAEKGITVPVETLKPNKVDIALDASVISGKDLIGPGFRLHGAAEKKNNIFDVTGMYSTKSGTGRSTMMVDGAYTRAIPLAKGLDATGTIGTSYTVQREVFPGGDNHGIFTPHISGGLRYIHKTPSGWRFGLKGEVGGAPKILVKSQKYHPQVQTVVTANGEAEVGYKNVSAFVTGGKGAIEGVNVGGGARVRF